MSHRESNCIQTGCYVCWHWWMAQYEPYPPAASPTFISSQPEIPPPMEMPHAVVTSDDRTDRNGGRVPSTVQTPPTSESVIKDKQQPCPTARAGAPATGAFAASIDSGTAAMSTPPDINPSLLVCSAATSSAAPLPTSNSSRSAHEAAFLNSEAGRKFLQFAGGKVMPK